MAAILNYAVLNKMNDLAEELTNIYSNDDWFFYGICFCDDFLGFWGFGESIIVNGWVNGRSWWFVICSN